jgi:hypothetical protein
LTDPAFLGDRGMAACIRQLASMLDGRPSPTERFLLSSHFASDDAASPNLSNTWVMTSFLYWVADPVAARASECGALCIVYFRILLIVLRLLWILTTFVKQ